MMLTAENAKGLLMPACDNTNPLLMYWAMIVDAGKGTTLLLSKLNFANGSSSISQELFTNDKLKGLKKRYKEINKDVDQLELGSSEDMALHSVLVFDDRIILTTGADAFSFGLIQ